MLDSRIRLLIDPALNYAGRNLARSGIGADAITLIGFGIGLAAVPLIAFGHYRLGLLAFLASRVLDGIDGAVARQTRPTDFGGYLDIVTDFIVYSAVPFAFALAQPEQAWAAALLIFSFVGTGSSFLAFAVMAEKRHVSTDLGVRKSLYYLGGLTEGTETILALGLCCLIPAHFATIALVFSGLCWITTATRILAAYDVFGPGRRNSGDS